MTKRALAVTELYGDVLQPLRACEPYAPAYHLELADEVRMLETLARRIRARIQPDWLALPLEILAHIASPRFCSRSSRRALRRTCHTLCAAVDLTFHACRVWPFHLRSLLLPPPLVMHLPFRLLGLRTVEVTFHANARPLDLDMLLDGRSLPALRNLAVPTFMFSEAFTAHAPPPQHLAELRVFRLPSAEEYVARLLSCHVERLVYDTSVAGCTGATYTVEAFQCDVRRFCSVVGRMPRCSYMRNVRRVTLLLDLMGHQFTHPDGRIWLRRPDVWPPRELLYGVFDELMIMDYTCVNSEGQPLNCADCIDARLFCLDMFAARIYVCGWYQRFARWGAVIAANPEHPFARYHISCVRFRQLTATGSSSSARTAQPGHTDGPVLPFERASMTSAVRNAAAFLRHPRSLLPPSSTPPTATFEAVFTPGDAHAFAFPSPLPIDHRPI